MWRGSLPGRFTDSGTRLVLGVSGAHKGCHPIEENLMAVQKNPAVGAGGTRVLVLGGGYTYPRSAASRGPVPFVGDYT